MVALGVRFLCCEGDELSYLLREIVALSRFSYLLLRQLALMSLSLPPWWCLLRPSYLLLSCSFSAYDDGLLLSRDDQLFPDGVLRCGL